MSAMRSAQLKTFETDGGVAVVLPADLGFGSDVQLQAEREGDRLVITPFVDDAERWRRFRAMIAALEALGPVPGGREERDTDWWPDRGER